MLKGCSIASGSKGNCLFVSSKEANILVDVGVDLKRLHKSLIVLGCSPQKLDGVLISHTHSDHISGLLALCKQCGVKVFCHQEIAAQIYKIVEKTKSTIVDFDGLFFIKDISINPFFVQHDVHCVGFSFVSNAKQLSIATDMGKYTSQVVDAVSGSDLVFVESNYDEEMLRNGNYPTFLKNRVSSDFGHLSNLDCGELVATLAQKGTKQFVLSHISQNNNYPELAYSSVVERLRASGLNLDSVAVDIALQDRLSNLYQL